MTNTTTPQALGERVERLVQEYISETRIAVQAAMDRAFVTSVGAGAKAKKQDQQAKRRMNARRPSAEPASLVKRLYAATCKAPGETMMVLAPVVGASPPSCTGRWRS